MIKRIAIPSIVPFTAGSSAIDHLSRANFLFGANGTGKTTISNLIRDESVNPDSKVLEWESGSPVKTYVYNRHFVSANFNSGRNINGIFTMCEDSVEAQKRIEELTKAVEKCKSSITITRMNGEPASETLSEAQAAQVFANMLRHPYIIGTVSKSKGGCPVEPLSCVERPVWRDHAPEPFQLVLEGGGMRGSNYTAGVADFLLDRGLCAQSVIGTSAGAITGFNYACGALGRTCLYNLKYGRDPRYVGVQSFLRTGNAFGANFVLDEIPNRIEPIDHGWFHESPIDVVTVASDMERGEADYHRFEKGSDLRRDMRYLAASSSMPLANRIVRVDGKCLLDGGVCDSVPFRAGRELAGLKQVIVLTRPESYVRPPFKGIAFARVHYAAYPRFTDRWARRHIEYNEQYREAARMHREGTAFLIRPDAALKASLLERDPDRLFDAYQAGMRDAARSWESLQRFLCL